MKLSKRELIEKILIILEENRFSKQDKINEFLNIDDKYLTYLLNELCGKHEEQPIHNLIRQRPDGFEITRWGIEYLNMLEIRKLQKQQTEFNKLLLTFTIVLVLFTVANIIMSAFGIWPKS